MRTSKARLEAEPVRWDSPELTSRTTPSLQLVVNQLMKRGNAIAPKVWNALRDLDARYARYIHWLPYPRLGVAELEAPTGERTSWDFTEIDPIVEDFFATSPRDPMVNFSTIPAWMFKTENPVEYPDDPYQPYWMYTQGTELRDPTLKELGGYFARLVSWYTKGGFVDENGVHHHSGHSYDMPIWQVLLEPEIEHLTTPEDYTARYDAIVEAVREVKPDMKFVGLELASSALAGQNRTYRGYPVLCCVDYVEYFLNPENHKPGIPIDYISYHFYAMLPEEVAQEGWAAVVFDMTNRFLKEVDYIEAIRRRLSPQTQTMIDELGCILPADLAQSRPDYVFKPFPDMYWNLCAAQYAFLFSELSRKGIEGVHSSALVQPVDYYPSTGMIDIETGRPNARYWCLKMIKENFGPGDSIMESTLVVNAGAGFGTTMAGGGRVYVQAFMAGGEKKILVVNTRDEPVEVLIPGTAGARTETVDQETAYEPPARSELSTDILELGGLAVTILTLREPG